MHTCSTMLIQSPSVSLQFVTTCFTVCIRCILDLLCREFDTNPPAPKKKLSRAHPKERFQKIQSTRFNNHQHLRTPSSRFPKTKQKSLKKRFINRWRVCLPWPADMIITTDKPRQGGEVSNMASIFQCCSKWIHHFLLASLQRQWGGEPSLGGMRRGVDVGWLWCVLLLWFHSFTLSNPYWFFS